MWKKKRERRKNVMLGIYLYLYSYFYITSYTVEKLDDTYAPYNFDTYILSLTHFHQEY